MSDWYDSGPAHRRAARTGRYRVRSTHPLAGWPPLACMALSLAVLLYVLVRAAVGT